MKSKKRNNNGKIKKKVKRKSYKKGGGNEIKPQNPDICKQTLYSIMRQAKLVDETKLEDLKNILLNNDYRVKEYKIKQDVSDSTLYNEGINEFIKDIHTCLPKWGGVLPIFALIVDNNSINEK